MEENGWIGVDKPRKFKIRGPEDPNLIKRERR
jgi:hypothetical protein